MNLETFQKIYRIDNGILLNSSLEVCKAILSFCFHGSPLYEWINERLKETEIFLRTGPFEILSAASLHILKFPSERGRSNLGWP